MGPRATRSSAFGTRSSRSPASSVVGGLGVELPTGRYRLVSPAALFDIGVLDPMLQPGSGSFDLLAEPAGPRAVSRAAAST